MSNEDPELEHRFTEEFAKLADRPFLLDTNCLTAWVIMSNLQLALRHPENTGPSSDIARRAALDIIETLAPPGTALREVADRGWNKEYDI